MSGHRGSPDPVAVRQPVDVPVVEAHDVWLRLGTTQALRGVSISVAAGEVVAVMGSSGSGKSSLLHCLAGLLRPDEGSVCVAGIDLSGLSDRARSRLRLERLGLVSQFGDLVPELTLRENVELPMRLLRRPGREVRRDTRDLLERMGIADVADRRAGEASGGQVQRAAVARALAHRPPIVLADEPTGALDTATGDRVLQALLDQARDGGAAVLLVTHEARVAAHADREVILRDGGLVADETRGFDSAAAAVLSRQ